MPRLDVPITAADLLAVAASGRRLSVAVEPSRDGVARIVIDAAPMHRALPAILLPVEALNLAADLKRAVEAAEPYELADASFAMRLAYEACDAFVAQAEAGRRTVTLEVIHGGRRIAETVLPTFDDEQVAAARELSAGSNL